MIGQNEGHMLGGKFVTRLALSASINLAVSTVSFGAELEIVQEGYHYQMPLTQNVYTETFVVSPVTGENTSLETTLIAEPEATPKFAQFTNPIVVYFQINNPAISADEVLEIRSNLSQQKISKTTPLVVTGHTCQKGPVQFNEWLSNERAKAVADLLRKEGYTVAVIEGRGAANLVSKKYHPINRRVEVTVFDQ